MELKISENPEITELGNLQVKDVFFHYASTAFYMVLHREGITGLHVDRVPAVCLDTGIMWKLHETMRVRIVRDVQIRGKL